MPPIVVNATLTTSIGATRACPASPIHHPRDHGNPPPHSQTSAVNRATASSAQPKMTRKSEALNQSRTARHAFRRHAATVVCNRRARGGFFSAESSGASTAPVLSGIGIAAPGESVAPRGDPTCAFADKTLPSPRRAEPRPSVPPFVSDLPATLGACRRLSMPPQRPPGPA